MSYLILDNIRSLHNVGSIFRTADAFGVSKVFLCGYTGKPLDTLGRPVKEIAKTALGAEKAVPWEYARHAWRIVERLKKAGAEVLAVENNVNGAVAIDTYIRRRHAKSRRGGEVALILGNEVNGISPQLLRRADAIVSLPMRGKKESLNVSVACGVALYALCR